MKTKCINFSFSIGPFSSIYTATYVVYDYILPRLCSAVASRGSEAASVIAALPAITASPTVSHVTATEAASHLACATRTRGSVSARWACLAQTDCRLSSRRCLHGGSVFNSPCCMIVTRRGMWQVSSVTPAVAVPSTSTRPAVTAAPAASVSEPLTGVRAPASAGGRCVCLNVLLHDAWIPAGNLRPALNDIVVRWKFKDDNLQALFI